MWASKHYLSRQRPLLIIKYQQMLTPATPPPAFTSPPILLFYLSAPPCLSSSCPPPPLLSSSSPPASFIWTCLLFTAKLVPVIVFSTFLCPSCLRCRLFTLNTTSGTSRRVSLLFPRPPVGVFLPLPLCYLPRGQVRKVGQGLALAEQQHPVIKVTCDQTFHGNWTLRGKTSP